MSTNWRSSTYIYTPNIEAYFERIGYEGPKDPTVETLQQIQWHHLLAIPFENLDIHSIGSVDISPEAIEKKLVYSNRGGFCYENNILLMHVLRALSFKVTPVIARTRWQRPKDIPSTPTHLVLKVEIAGVLWMADAGFSSFGTLFPLRIDTEEVQHTPMEDRRILHEETCFVQQMYAQEKWSDIFSFTLDESYPMDWEMGAYYVVNHPTCPAKLSSLVSIPTKTCRYLLLNNVLSTRHSDGTSESREVTSEREYLDVLRSVFHIHLPDGVKVRVPNTIW
jgi:N-hydroxyarylamine O-acetyltransferase